MKISIRMGVMAGFSLIFIIFSIFLILLTVNNLQATLENTELSVAKKELALFVNNINTFNEERIKDIQTLSELPPVQGIIRARYGKGIDIEGSSTYDDWVGRMQEIFTSLMRSDKFYTQLRYIDENGSELVRVDKINNSINAVPSEKLQNKKDRYYFAEAIKEEKGRTYVSRLDLNREGTPPTISIPHDPVMRYALPIFDDNNSRKGIIISNVRINDFFSKIREPLVKKNHILFIVDKDGYYLFHLIRSKEFGDPNNLNTGENIFNDMPDIADKILSEKRGSIVDKDNIITYVPIMTINNGKNSLIAVNIISKKEIFSLSAALKRKLIIIDLLLLLVLISFSYMVSYIFSKSIDGIREDIDKISKGNLNVKLGKSSLKDIQSLIDSLNRILVSLKLAVRKVGLSKRDLKLGEVIKAKEEIEKKLKITEEKYKILTDLSPDCIKLLDKDGKIIFMNDAGLKEHGFRRLEDTAGWNFMDSVVKEQVGKVKKSFSGALEGKTSTIEIKHTKKGSNREWCLETISPVKDEKGEVISIFAVSRDITLIKRTSLKFEKKKIQLEKFAALAVGREEKMIELKNKIKELEKELSKYRRKKR